MHIPKILFTVIGLALCLPLSADDLPRVEIAHVFAPQGESNVRSSIQLEPGVGLIGTEESGLIFKTGDDGRSWRQVFDGEATWGIADVRNFIKAEDGNVYITTTEPALVACSTDEGETWEIVHEAPASRTVGLTQLESGTILVGLRRSENQRTSILRTEDYFDTVEWIAVDKDAPRQNVTCFGYWGGESIFAGVGFEGSGKVYQSTDDGRSWKRVAEFPEARDLMGFFKTGEEIYVLASGIATIFKSSDKGATWSKSMQFWEKGFLGECVSMTIDNTRYRILSATDQRHAVYRHVLLVSRAGSNEWKEWVDFAKAEKGRVTSAKESGGGASNLAPLSGDTIVVGIGNHAVQGKAYTLQILPDAPSR